MTNPTQRIHEILDHGEAIEKAATETGQWEERWLPISGCDGYEVSDFGNVRSLFRRGNHRVKLQGWQAAEIKYLGEMSVPREKIAALFDVSRKYVDQVIAGKTWKAQPARTSEPRLHAALRVAMACLEEGLDNEDYSASLAEILAALEGKS